MSTSLSGSRSSSSMSKQSMPANFLNSTALPSITGLAGERADGAEAQHRGAVGDDADQIAARGQVARLAGSRTISSQAAATPGVYASARSRWLVSCLVGAIAILPGGVQPVVLERGLADRAFGLGHGVGRAEGRSQRERGPSVSGPSAICNGPYNSGPHVVRHPVLARSRSRWSSRRSRRSSSRCSAARPRARVPPKPTRRRRSTATSRASSTTMSRPASSARTSASARTRRSSRGSATSSPRRPSLPPPRRRAPHGSLRS